MILTSADLSTAVLLHLPSNSADGTFIRQAAIDLLNFILPIAPEGAVHEIIKTTISAAIPSTGLGEVSIQESAGGSSTGVFKVVSVFQAQAANLTGTHYKARLVSFLQLMRIVESYPQGTPIYSSSESIWALDEGAKSVKLFSGEPNWYIVPVFLETPEWKNNNTELEMPAGWESIVANFVIARWWERDEQFELAAQYMGDVARELGKFGIYYDKAKSHAGAGKA